jgi:hypothetical protein
MLCPPETLYLLRAGVVMRAALTFELFFKHLVQILIRFPPIILECKLSACFLFVAMLE